MPSLNGMPLRGLESPSAAAIAEAQARPQITEVPLRAQYDRGAALAFFAHIQEPAPRYRPRPARMPTCAKFDFTR